ncbi:MAG TPA: hypothetical protein PLV01_05190, partial [Candidatus Kapabacteria bacterium]|nr:hypothetical protein [Candidatus Kapabacteria bacterium]
MISVASLRHGRFGTLRYSATLCFATQRPLRCVVPRSSSNEVYRDERLSVASVRSPRFDTVASIRFATQRPYASLLSDLVLRYSATLCFATQRPLRCVV